MFETIEITCPKCRNKFKKKIGGIHDARNLPCPKCGALIDAKEAIKRATEEVTKVDREIGKLLK